MHALLTALLGLTGAGSACGASAARCATAIVRAARVLATRPPLRLGRMPQGGGLLLFLPDVLAGGPRGGRLGFLRCHRRAGDLGLAALAGRRRPGLGIGAIILALTSERVVRRSTAG